MHESGAQQFSGSFGQHRGGPRFRFRTDLQVNHEDPRDNGTISVRVIDPITGKLFAFTKNEFLLCQLADGRNRLQEILEQYQEHTGLVMEPRELAFFYRRLAIFGLMERTDVQGAQVPQGGSMLQGGRFGGAENALHQAGFGGAEPIRRPLSVALFNPSWLLVLLYILLYPLKFLRWLLWPAVLMAGMTLFSRWDAFAEDFIRLSSSLSIITTLIIALLTVNLASRLVQGMVIRSYGGYVREIGLLLLMGFVPRFYIDTSSIRNLDRRAQLRSHSAPLMTRLLLFAVGTMIWVLTRHTGTWLPDAALVVAQGAFLAFALTAMPFLPADGYKWLATQLGRPRLKETSLAILKAKLTGRPLPDAAAEGDVLGMVLFGSALVLATGVFVLGVMLYLGILLEQRFHGAGVAMFFGLFGAFVIWIISIKLTVRKARARTESMRARAASAAGEGPRGQDGADANAGVVTLPAENIMAAYSSPESPAPNPRFSTALSRPGMDAVSPFGAGGALAQPSSANIAFSTDQRSSSSVARIVWAVFALVLLGVAFLPYDYEVGGEFTILPSSRVDVNSRRDGEVTKVLVKEGDWVKKDAVIAILSDWDEVRNVAVARAELEKARAQLAKLEDGAKPEQIVVAAKEVKRSESRVVFAKAEAKRATILVKKGHISVKAAEQADSDYQKSLADLAVANAELDLIKSGATKSELEVARAEVRRNELELAFRKDELERTRVRAPAGGRIITPNLEYLLGKYVNVGHPIANLEDSRMARAELAIAETDIGEVQLNDRVRLKAWGYSDAFVHGRVVSVAPVAEERSYGRVVRVVTEVRNEHGRLKSNMTGYGKIEASELPVWQAFLKMFIRFVQIEVWSWIP